MLCGRIPPCQGCAISPHSHTSMLSPPGLSNRRWQCEIALLCRVLSLRHAAGMAWGDMAVLCRTNRAVRCVTAALRHAGLPTNSEEDHNVVRDGAVSRMRALWRLCLHPRDDAAFHEACFGVGCFLAPDARAAVRKVSALHRMAHLDVAEAVAALERGRPAALAAGGAAACPATATLSPPQGAATADAAIRDLVAALPAQDRRALARMASVVRACCTRAHVPLRSHTQCALQVRGLRDRAAVLTLPALVDRTARMAPLAFRAPPAPTARNQSRKRGRSTPPSAGSLGPDADSGHSGGSSEEDEAGGPRERRRPRPQCRRRRVLAFLSARAKAFERRLARADCDESDVMAGLSYSQCSLASSATEPTQLPPRLHRLAAFVSDVDMLCEEASHRGDSSAETRGHGDPAPAPGVCVCTIHRAKGLEWPLVIVPFAAEGTLPLERSRDPLAAVRAEEGDAVQRRAQDHQRRDETLEVCARPSRVGGPGGLAQAACVA